MRHGRARCGRWPSGPASGTRSGLSGRGRRLPGLRGASCPLTLREREFLQLAADGWRDLEIAERLEVPERTVRTSIRRIGRAVGAPDRSALLVLALRAGVVV